MAVMTIRLTDALHARLKELARSRGLSANKPMEELATVALVQQDTAARFTMRAQRGNVARGLAICVSWMWSLRRRFEASFKEENRCLPAQNLRGVLLDL